MYLLKQIILNLRRNWKTVVNVSDNFLSAVSQLTQLFGTYVGACLGVAWVAMLPINIVAPVVPKIRKRQMDYIHSFIML